MKLTKLKNLFEQAYTVAKNSKDAETKVGCLIVDDRGRTLASGYNGFIAGTDDSKLPRVRPAKYEYTIHAEVNAVCQAASSSQDISGAVCICTLSPCTNCLRVLWQCGIRTVYFREEYKDFKKQLQMKDLRLNLTKVGKFVRIDLEA